MYEFIAKIILFGSTCGMAIILFRKIPVLAELPEKPEQPLSIKNSFFDLEEKIKVSFIKSLSFEKLLQKLLLRFKFLALKTDKLTSKWIASLRSRSIKKRNNLTDGYWEKIKKERSTKKEKKIIVK